MNSKSVLKKLQDLHGSQIASDGILQSMIQRKLPLTQGEYLGLADGPEQQLQSGEDPEETAQLPLWFYDLPNE